MLTLDVLEQAAAPRPYLTHPILFVGTIPRPFAQPATQIAQRRSIRHRADCESTDERTPDTVGALGVFVLPLRRIARRGRQDVYVMTLGSLLRKQPAGVFGTSAELSAVSRCDEGELHWRACVGSGLFPRERVGWLAGCHRLRSRRDLGDCWSLLQMNHVHGLFRN